MLVRIGHHVVEIDKQGGVGLGGVADFVFRRLLGDIQAPTPEPRAAPDSVAAHVAGLGFRAVLAEGADAVLGWRSPNFVYVAPGASATRLLLSLETRNRRRHRRK